MVATVRKPSYTAVCRRVGSWWAVDVPEIRGLHTQARRLDQVEAMTREAIALLREVPADSFTLTVEPHLDEHADRSVAAATEAAERARQTAEEASRLQRSVAATLVKEYRLTVRDAGSLLRVSPQRISQLAQPTKSPSPRISRSRTTSRASKARQGRGPAG